MQPSFDVFHNLLDRRETRCDLGNVRLQGGERRLIFRLGDHGSLGKNAVLFFVWPESSKA